MRAYAKEHVGLTRAVFELYRGVFSCFVVMQASALSVGQRLLFMWTLVCFAHWSFSLIRKMEMGETIIHPLCGCASIVIQKNYLSVYNKVVQAIL